MTNIRWSNLASLLLIMGAAGSVSAAVGSATAQQTDKLAAILPMCATCHGVDGVSSVGGYPNLAGQKHEYLAKQLRDFRSGQRNDVVMRPMAEPLDDALIDALSRHFGQMPGAR